MKNKVHLSTESRIHREVYVRFGGRLSKTCRSNTTRRRVPSLHKVFDIEKRESIKTLILTLWKKDNEPATRSEEVALSNAVSLYIRRIKEDESIVPSFNSFYEFVKTDYRRILDGKEVRERDFDLAGFLNVLENMIFCLTPTSSLTCSVSGLSSSKLIRSKITPFFFR